MRTKYWPENLKGRQHFEDGAADDNIKTDLKEVRCEGANWIVLA
jgi:hypothetical protein